MKHLYFALPLVLCFAVACDSPKKTEKPKTPPEKEISMEAVQQAPETLKTSHATITSQPTTQGDEPASLADIERYYEVMQMREQMKQLTEIMSHQTKQMMHEAIKDQPQLPPGAEERLNALYTKITSHMPTEELLQSMAPIYAKHFTKNDINAIITFYSSPVGKKMIAETPKITQEAMQASIGTMQKYMKQTMDEINAMIEQIKQENEAAQAEASAIESEAPAAQPEIPTAKPEVPAIEPEAAEQK